MSKVSAEDVVRSLFDPGETVHVRIFDDKKSGTFAGMKLAVEAGKFSSIMEQLKKHNALNRGIFFVVNAGGDDDKSITRVNAQFVECDDLSMEEQIRQVEAFPLPPSMEIKTRRSLHTYWFIKDGDVTLYRPIQKALVEKFHGDPVCVNESRVMRLPGFYHCKADPVEVECISFHPERRYTQEELMQLLPVKQEEKLKETNPIGTVKGLALVLTGCDFMKHCREDAATLSEHDWYAMLTNLASFEGGTEKIHELSAPYPNYKREDTNAKIQHFLKSGTGPMTCAVIAEKGFKCPRMGTKDCTCKAPAAMCYQPITTDMATRLINTLPVSSDAVENLKVVQHFVTEYLYNLDTATAQGIINHILRSKFSLTVADVRPVIAEQKKMYAAFQKKQEEKKRQASQGQIPAWYEVTERGLRFMPDVLAKHMAENVHAFYAAEQFWRYESGVYKAMSDLTAKSMVRAKMLEGHATMVQISDATGQWKLAVLKDSRELNANPYMINVRNGIYNVLENKLTKHTPEFLSTVQLNVNFSSQADCPRFKEFLHQCVDDDQVPLLQEMLGYFLVPVNKAQKSFVIVGEAGAGKSVLLRVLNEILLGKENVSNVSWQALNERFKTAELYGKLANIFADLPTKNIDDNGIFKALVGEDYLTVERKNKDPFNFQNYARLLFSCNEIPKNFGDRSEGFYRRLIIIRFPHAVPKEKRDPMLLEKFRAEADGIFRFALDGLIRLMNQNWRFSETRSNIEERQRYREESNSALSFVAECCELGDGFEVGRTEFYSQYQMFCKDSGLSPFSQTRFNKEIEIGYPGVARAKDKTGRRKTWRGIRYVDDAD